MLQMSSKISSIRRVPMIFRSRSPQIALEACSSSVSRAQALAQHRTGKHSMFPTPDTQQRRTNQIGQLLLGQAGGKTGLSEKAVHNATGPFLAIMCA